MKHLFLTISILFLISFHSQAQTQNLQGIRNRLFCNVYDYQHADRTTNRFLRANFPYLTEPRQPGGLSMPPVGVNSKRQIISMKFQEHPFFHFKLKEGRVDFHAIIMSPTQKFENGAELWLVFENENDANAAFKMLTDTLASASNDKKTTTDNGQTTAVFTGKGNDNSAYIVKLILKKDEAGDYAIFLPDYGD